MLPLPLHSPPSPCCCLSGLSDRAVSAKQFNEKHKHSSIFNANNAKLIYRMSLAISVSSRECCAVGGTASHQLCICVLVFCN